MARKWYKSGDGAEVKQDEMCKSDDRFELASSRRAFRAGKDIRYMGAIHETFPRMADPLVHVMHRSVVPGLCIRHQVVPPALCQQRRALQRLLAGLCDFLLQSRPSTDSGIAF